MMVHWGFVALGFVGGFIGALTLIGFLTFAGTGDTNERSENV